MLDFDGIKLLSINQQGPNSVNTLSMSNHRKESACKLQFCLK
jgi:hypothetical protein